jgi:hypothetical protein
LKKVQVEWKVEKVWWRGKEGPSRMGLAPLWGGARSEERGSEDAKSLLRNTGNSCGASAGHGKWATL